MLIPLPFKTSQYIYDFLSAARRVVQKDAGAEVSAVSHWLQSCADHNRSSHPRNGLQTRVVDHQF